MHDLLPACTESSSTPDNTYWTSPRRDGEIFVLSNAGRAHLPGSTRMCPGCNPKPVVTLARMSSPDRDAPQETHFDVSCLFRTSCSKTCRLQHGNSVRHVGGGRRGGGGLRTSTTWCPRLARYYLWTLSPWSGPRGRTCKPAPSLCGPRGAGSASSCQCCLSQRCPSVSDVEYAPHIHTWRSKAPQSSVKANVHFNTMR